MYPSGPWRGYWQQAYYGRQSMRDFVLNFQGGDIRGHGTDIVGPFTFQGTYDLETGHVQLTKQYIDQHQVHYVGQGDGEGSIFGTWSMTVFGLSYEGPFVLQPVPNQATASMAIEELAVVR
jgi:hypothetical protein